MRGYFEVVRTVVAREYLQRVRTKSFILSTLATPILLLGMFGITAYFGARAGSSGEQGIALVDRSGVLAESVQTALQGVGFQVEVVPPDSEEEAGLTARLRDETLRAVLFLGPETLEVGEAVLRAVDPPSAIRRLALQQAVSQAAVSVRLSEIEDGASLRTLLAGGGVRIERLEEDAADEDGAEVAGMVAGFVGAFLLYMVLLIYGATLLRAVLEEKTGRIAEVILASMRPSQLMLGKIVGVGAVGLTQVGVWFLLGALAVGAGLPFMMGMLPEMIPDLDIWALLPSAGVLAFFLVCFVLGYFLYASMFAAVGAMVSSEEEAQQLQVPVVILVIVPILFLMPTLENPTEPWAVAASLFPFFSPILMFARVAVGAAPIWQAGLSVLLMLAMLLGVATVAGRIYRTGILMQGKRPTLPEIWRWVRTG
jgi:ABC-2 type transport system permease protein